MGGRQPRAGRPVNGYKAGRRSPGASSLGKAAWAEGTCCPPGASPPGLLLEEATELTLQQGLLLPPFEMCPCLCLSGDLRREATPLNPSRAPKGDECRCN